MIKIIMEQDAQEYDDGVYPSKRIEFVFEDGVMWTELMEGFFSSCRALGYGFFAHNEQMIEAAEKANREAYKKQ